MTLRQTRPVIIGLVGPSGAGKTTVCEYLRTEYAFTVIHVAQPLKRAFVDMFSVGAHMTERPYIEEQQMYLGGVTPRMVLEHWGSTLHAVAPAALPNLLHRKISSLLRVGENRILVDGIRRATEAEVIKLRSGIMWRAAAGDVDPNKPCDISQIEVETDAAIPWIEAEADRYTLLDGLLAPVLAGARTHARGSRNNRGSGAIPPTGEAAGDA